jgi:hypothetical protein
VVRLERPEAIAELIAAIIGISEGAIDPGGAKDELVAAGRRDAAAAVANALAAATRPGGHPGQASPKRLRGALRRLTRR